MSFHIGMGSETEQVIARGWRLGSHEALIKKWEQNGQVGKKPQIKCVQTCSNTFFFVKF